MKNQIAIVENESFDLLVIQSLTPSQIFEGQDITEMIDKIDHHLSNIVIDSSTDKGRKEIISLSVKVRDSKTFIDKSRKEYIDDKKKFIDAVNEKAKLAVTRLQELQERTRLPVTEYENRIKEKEDRMKSQIEALRSFKTVNPLQTISLLNDELSKLKEIEVNDSWEEHKNLGERLYFEATNHLTESIASRAKYEIEQAELEELRKEKAARDIKENEERLIKEAAEKERLDSLARQAQADENKRLEMERAKAALEKAEIDKKEAVEKAQKEERLRIERELAQKEAEAKKREDNQNHSKKINNKILAALMALSVEESIGKEVIKAMARGEIPNVKINY